MSWTWSDGLRGNPDIGDKVIGRHPTTTIIPETFRTDDRDRKLYHLCKASTMPAPSDCLNAGGCDPCSHAPLNRIPPWQYMCVGDGRRGTLGVGFDIRLIVVMKSCTRKRQ